MYGTLSTNVHRFRDGKISLKGKQWNINEYGIMSFLIPKNKLRRGGRLGS